MEKITGHPNEMEIARALEKRRNRKEDLDFALIRLDELKARIEKLHYAIRLIDMELDWLGYERD